MQPVHRFRKARLKKTTLSMVRLIYLALWDALPTVHSSMPDEAVVRQQSGDLQDERAFKPVTGYRRVHWRKF